MRRMAFRELESPELAVPASTRIALGEKYEAHGAFVGRAMSELATRSRALTEEEGEELGGAVTATIMSMSEEHRSRYDNGWGSYVRPRYPQYDYSPPRVPSPGPPPQMVPVLPEHIPQPLIIQPPPQTIVVPHSPVMSVSTHLHSPLPSQVIDI